MIDFKEKMEKELGYQEPKKKKIGLKITGFLLAFFVLFTTTVLVSEDASDSWAGKIPVIGRLIGLVESSDKKIKGEDEDRINIILLGMGGKQHEGGYLTDTIMLASLQPSTQKIAFMSIPRDMVIAIEGMEWQKINAVNAFAERKKSGSGGEAVSQAISDILGISIHYYIRVDFAGFVNIIDHLGGINVYVENNLEDFRYPIEGRESHPDYYSRFEHLYIPKGWHVMDGALALKYSRSRHAQGIEGSDFARARRQQIVIQAVKDKLLSTENLLKPTMLASIISELNEHLSFNLKIWESLKLWQLFKDINSDNISNYVLDDGPNGLLVSGRSEMGAYILKPRGGDFNEIQYLVTSFFPKNDVKISETEKIESAKIEIKNGTWINGLANQTSIDLAKKGFEVLRVSNSNQRDFKQSTIYDLSYGAKPESLSYLKNALSAQVSLSIPDWLVEEIKNDIGNNKEEVPDFLIILGESAYRLNF